MKKSLLAVFILALGLCVYQINRQGYVFVRTVNFELFDNYEIIPVKHLVSGSNLNISFGLDIPAEHLHVPYLYAESIINFPYEFTFFINSENEILFENPEFIITHSSGNIETFKWKSFSNSGKSFTNPLPPPNTVEDSETMNIRIDLKAHINGKAEQVNIIPSALQRI